MHAEIPIACRGHWHLFERIEGHARLEVTHERQAPFFQQSYVQTAISFEFFLEVEEIAGGVLVGFLLHVPRVKLLASLDDHSVRNLRFGVGDGIMVILVGGCV